jgi:hypothetical protein
MKKVKSIRKATDVLHLGTVSNLQSAKQRLVQYAKRDPFAVLPRNLFVNGERNPRFGESDAFEDYYGYGGQLNGHGTWVSFTWRRTVPEGEFTVVGATLHRPGNVNQTLRVMFD